ncbi:Uncharacterised protein [Mannheimia haemolytica]|uniref:Uncharacterized protein n=1 Tax=Mannheimia haemolytica TaxID=75985 RepID=A0A378N6B6_MANHA|nr:Uncharacterised protein [Mannheimia haemolytica]
MQQLEPQTFASWAEPIDMLYACHSKVKSFCKQLQILPDYLEKNGVNQAVKNDVQQILNYFNISALYITKMKKMISSLSLLRCNHKLKQR